MTSAKCPICKEGVKLRSENAFFPFCSNRCKVADLAKWLDGDYVIVARDEDEGDGVQGGETLH